MALAQRLRSSSTVSQPSVGGHPFTEAGRPNDEQFANYEDQISSSDTSYVKEAPRPATTPTKSASPVRQTKLRKDVYRSASAKSRLRSLLQPASYRKSILKESTREPVKATSESKTFDSLALRRHTPEIPGHWPTPSASETDSIVSRPNSSPHLPLPGLKGNSSEFIGPAAKGRQQAAMHDLKSSDQAQSPQDEYVAFGANPRSALLHNGVAGQVQFVEERLGDVRRAPDLWIVRNSQNQPSLEGVIDMTSSEEVDRQSITLDRPVVRETVQPVVHHIRQELISRDIHRPEVFRRILPIRDIQVNPARHFVLSPIDDSLVEIDGPPTNAPSSKLHEHHKYTHLTSSKHIVEDADPSHRHRLGRSHSREKSNAPYQVKQETIPDTADGIKRMHTYSRYSPVLDDEARIRGGTVPFAFQTQIPGKPVPSEQDHGASERRRLDDTAVKVDATAPQHSYRTHADMVRSSNQRPLPRSDAVSAPRRKSIPKKTVHVTPWEFSHEGQDVADNDIAVRGGHSIASEHGQELLRQRSTSRYKRV